MADSCLSELSDSRESNVRYWEAQTFSQVEGPLSAQKPPFAQIGLNCLLLTADSIGRRTTFIKFLCRGIVTQGLPRAII